MRVSVTFGGSLGHSRLGERRQRGEGDQQGEGCALQAKHSIVFRVLPQATSHPTGIGAIGQRQPPPWQGEKTRIVVRRTEGIAAKK